MSQKTAATVVFDVGKTNVKLCALGPSGESLALRTRANSVVPGPPYPHHDADALFEWALRGLAELGRELAIDAVVTTTHGATAALVSGTRLALPVLDYEHDVGEFDADYEALARDFAGTGSPRLPLGLNLGRQLFWLSKRFPEAFASATDVLLYPQYFAFRLTGEKFSEVTSLGCHTDLWLPAQSDYAPLVSKLGWGHLFPRRAPAWAKAGTLSPKLADATGLARETIVLTGIHDSNASFFPYRAGREPPFTVISSGTWVISMAAGVGVELEPDRDLLLNVDAFGSPVASSRFMGGREYAALAGEDGLSITPEPGDLERLIARGTLAVPCFAAGGGPFRARRGEVRGPAPANARERAALATLYVALMTDYCLDLLSSSGDVLVEGSFAKNPALTAVLAGLRTGQRVSLSTDATGTTLGAALLARFAGGQRPEPALTTVSPLLLPGLGGYRNAFRKAALGS